MKVNGNAVRPGNVLMHKDRLWRVVSVQSVKPGKGGAYAQIEMKDLKSGNNLQERFRASQQVERARLESESYQFLFSDKDSFTFMNQITFEQIILSSEFIGDKADLISEGMVIQIESHDQEVIALHLPENITLKVIEAEAVVKRQTASASFKPAMLDGGIRVQVPQYIVAGDLVTINSQNLSFVERDRS